MSEKDKPRFVRGPQRVLTEAEWSAIMAKKKAREMRSSAALALAIPAFERLLKLAETERSGQIKRVALFIGACWNGCRHFDFLDFRSLGQDIGDDMMAVLDAHRYSLCDVEKMVPNGNQRIVAVLTAWGMYGEGQTGQMIVTRTKN